MELSVTVNGQPWHKEVEPRLLLSDFLRHHLGLRGTHVGCEQGICGACTVLVDALPVRSCLLFAVQAEGCSVETSEHLEAGGMSGLLEAFSAEHAVQCGFCTPGILIEAAWLLRQKAGQGLDEGAVREALSGNLCRCTGYQNIVRAVLSAAKGGPAHGQG